LLSVQPNWTSPAEVESVKNEDEMSVFKTDAAATQTTLRKFEK
jgi:hypothetical protein